MSTDRATKGLGKGLSALLGEAPTAAPPAAHASGGPRQIEIGRIRPNPQQPRTHFDEAAIEELADSISFRICDGSRGEAVAVAPLDAVKSLIISPRTARLSA